MTELRISALSKRFTDTLAVDEFDIEIEDGEFISLLGPSGCGKTTTLRCIAGFETASEGHIYFDSRDVVGLEPDKRNIGMVFQNYALFPHMTVEQNLAFGLEMRDVKPDQITARTDAILETVQLTGLKDRYVNQLSGGQRQRVALARALVIEPSILLLDEPLANLDAKLREEMRFFIRDLQKRFGITTLYVTHDQGEAMVMSDRIVVMFDGRIHQIGRPRDIYDRPASREVADFIGLSNFIPASVVKPAKEKGQFILDSPFGTLRCLGDEALQKGDNVLLVCRPETLEVQPAKQGIESKENTLVGEISQYFYLGNQVSLTVKSGDQHIQVQTDPWTSLDVGDQIACSFDVERTWVIPRCK